MMTAVLRMADLDDKPISEAKRLKEAYKIYDEIVQQKTGNEEMMESFCGTTDILSFGSSIINGYQNSLLLTMTADIIGRERKCDCGYDQTYDKKKKNKRKRAKY